jgi:molybdopterin/thiamine biosynthesis adenylyltransferase
MGVLAVEVSPPFSGLIGAGAREISVAAAAGFAGSTFVVLADAGFSASNFASSFPILRKRSAPEALELFDEVGVLREVVQDLRTLLALENGVPHSLDTTRLLPAAITAS